MVEQLKEQDRNTIPYMLQKRARENGKDVVYSFPSTNQHYSWSRLWGEVSIAAKGLLKLGVRKGDTIAVLMPGRIELIVSMYAAACVGAIIVPINTYSKKEELEKLLRDACPTVMLLSKEASHIPHLKHLQQLMRECQQAGGDGSWLPPHVFVLDTLPGDREGFYAYEQLFAMGEQVEGNLLRDACRDIRPKDPLILLYTSGTTGSSKGVLRTTASFLTTESQSIIKEAQDNTPLGMRMIDWITKHFSILNLLPLYHLGGFATIFTALKSCNIRIVMLGYYHPVQALAAVQQEKCRVLVGTPYMIQRMTDAPERKEYKLNSLLGVAFTSSAVNSAMVKKLVDELKLSFFMVSYGSSEAGAVANGTCMVDKRGNPLLLLLYRMLKRTSLLSGMLSYEHFTDGAYSLAGKVDKAVEIKIVHPESGAVLPSHENGEILIRSYRVMRYTKEQADRASVSEDGWYKSGDLGYLDERNLLTITGRLNRMISRGGEKISPVEIENALLLHGGVQDALVLGIPNELYGEQICACVVTPPGVEQSADLLRAKLSPYISAFKLPQYILFLPMLPLAPTGKVSVAELKLLVQQSMGELLENA